MHWKWGWCAGCTCYVSSRVSSPAYLCLCVLFRFFFDKVRFLALFFAVDSFSNRYIVHLGVDDNGACGLLYA